MKISLLIKFLMVLSICLFTSSCAKKVDSNRAHFYVGTYTLKMGHVHGKAKGISYWSLDLTSGEMKQVGDETAVVNSSHLCLGKNENFLYSISEVSEFDGKKDGYLTVLKVHKDGSLETLQKVSSEGVGPAYVSLDRSGRFLLLANYVAGNSVVYPIQSDGLLGQPTANVMHQGASVNRQRQEGPHPHSIVPSLDNRFVYIADLGIDKIKAYAFDQSSGALSPRTDLDIVTPAGSGPRHLIFSPDGRHAFVSLEMFSQVAAYSYDNGKLSEVGIYDTLPEGFKGDSSTAEIRISADGRFVYVSNRGHDSIAVFAVDPSKGSLKRVQVSKVGGLVPRNFALDPSGRMLLVGHQNSHTISSFIVDQKTGLLSPTNITVAAKSPVLLCFKKNDESRE